MDDVKPKANQKASSEFSQTLYSVIADGRFAPLFLTLLFSVETVILLLKANKRLMWYDELVTLHVSSIGPFSELLKALSAGADSMTPFYYLMVRLGKLIPADPHITMRVASIAGYLFTLWGVYWFSRKWLPVTGSLAAVLLVTLSPFRDYAIEARSYALLVGFLALAACFWQRVGERRFMALLFGIALLLAVSTHYLGVVAIGAFVVAELSWSLERHAIRRSVWLACFAAATPFLVCLPISTRFRSIFKDSFWAQPSWRNVYTTYQDYLGINYRLGFAIALFFGLLFADWLIRRVRARNEDGEKGFDQPGFVLISSLLFYPAVLALLTPIVGSGYTPRYGWPGLLGLVLGPVYLLRSFWAKPYSAYLALALMMTFAFQGANDCEKAYKSKRSEDHVNVRFAEIVRGIPDVPVVIGSPLSFLERREYAPPELQPRLKEVLDPNQARLLVGSDSSELVNGILNKLVIPLPIETLPQFEASRTKFLLEAGGPGDWLTGYLLKNGYHLRTIGSYASFWLFEVER